MNKRESKILKNTLLEEVAKFKLNVCLVSNFAGDKDNPKLIYYRSKMEEARGKYHVLQQLMLDFGFKESEIRILVDKGLTKGIEWFNVATNIQLRSE
jgi:hypothetical protein